MTPCTLLLLQQTSCAIHKWKRPTFLRFALKRSVALSSELYLAALVQRHAPKTLKT